MRRVNMKKIPELYLILALLCLSLAGCSSMGTSAPSFVEAQLVGGDTVLYKGNRYSVFGFLKHLKDEGAARGAVVKMHIPDASTTEQQKRIASQFLSSGYQIIMAKPRKTTAITDPDGKSRPAGRR